MYSCNGMVSLVLFQRVVKRKQVPTHCWQQVLNGW
jgi:hypothetical protein